MRADGRSAAGTPRRAAPALARRGVRGDRRGGHDRGRGSRHLRRIIPAVPPIPMRSKLLVPLLALALSASAQTPYLVKDLNTIGSSSPASSVPEGFIRFGTRVYFAATTANGGRKLWSTDGTPAGTALVANIGGPSPSSPSRFVVVNGKLLFNGTDVVHGEELWGVDVPQTASHLLADIAPGMASSVPNDRILYHGKLLFAADDGKSGMELWSTD